MRLPSIEAAVRSAFSWTLVRLLGGGPAPPLPNWRDRPYRVLFIRDDGIGDLMLTTEVLRAISQVSPTITLDLVCSPSNAAFARGLPYVNDVIVHKRGFLLAAWPTWRRLRRGRYDAVVDGRVAIGNVNKQTTLLMLSTGAKWRIGIAGRRNDRVYNVPIHVHDERHWVDLYAMLADPFGVDSSKGDWRPRLVLTDEQRATGERLWRAAGSGRPRVLVNLSSAQPDRQWPVDRFAPVLARVRELMPDAAIIVSSMPNQRGDAERLARPVSASAPQMSLPDVTGVTAAADLVISPDTAITVIAAAFQVPVLALMRKGTQRWVPYRNAGLAVFGDEPPTPPTLVGLSVERVIAALDRIVGDLGRTRGWLTA